MIIRQTIEGLEISWRSGGSRIVPLLTAEEVFQYLPEYENFEFELRAGLSKSATANALPLQVVHSAMLRKYPDLSQPKCGKTSTTKLYTMCGPAYGVVYS